MDNESDKQLDPTPRRAPLALLIWIMIFIAVAVLIAYRYNPMNEAKDWDQSKFERELSADRIIELEITEENEKVYKIKGLYKVDPKQPTPEKGEPKKEGNFFGRIYLSDVLFEKIRNNQNIKLTINPKETWWGKIGRAHV